PAAARDDPLDVAPAGALEQAHVEVLARRETGIDDGADVECLQHRGCAADVVRVRVREDQGLEAADAVREQERHHACPAGIEAFGARSGVDEDPAAARGADRVRVALPYVDRVDLERAAAADQRRPGDEEGHGGPDGDAAAYRGPDARRALPRRRSP